METGVSCFKTLQLQLSFILASNHYTCSSLSYLHPTITPVQLSFMFSGRAQWAGFQNRTVSTKVHSHCAANCALYDRLKGQNELKRAEMKSAMKAAAQAVRGILLRLFRACFIFEVFCYACSEHALSRHYSKYEFVVNLKIDINL